MTTTINGLTALASPLAALDEITALRAQVAVLSAINGGNLSAQQLIALSSPYQAMDALTCRRVIVYLLTQIINSGL